MENRIYNVLDFGAVADGVTINSEAVQRAIDTCALQGGGTVLFEGGEFVLSTVFLKENITICIDKTARILGAPSFYDYAPQEQIDYPLYQDASHSYFDHSMFVGKNCDDLTFTGGGEIDMRSVWDEDDVRKIVGRGPKTIALRECNNVKIYDLEINNTTDLAIYFAGCEDVEIYNIKMRVYIDGISPDNCKNVYIHDCDVESGDDGIVFKSSYTLNRLGVCDNITVKNCRVKSRCSAVKFGTETNGGFYNFTIDNIDIRETRITAIAIESVDGAIIDGLTLKNMHIRNAGAPLFIHLGLRMRGPEGREIGRIRNITLENIVAEGPYEPWEAIAWNMRTHHIGDTLQYPWDFTSDHVYGPQLTSNVCGLPEIPLENIVLKNVKFIVEGNVFEWRKDVPDNANGYPEVHIYGRPLPAKGIYFRHINGLTLDNVTVESYKPDGREDFVFDDVENLIIV